MYSGLEIEKISPTEKLEWWWVSLFYYK